MRTSPQRVLQCGSHSVEEEIDRNNDGESRCQISPYWPSQVERVLGHYYMAGTYKRKSMDGRGL